MGRRLRNDAVGVIFHAVNRTRGGGPLFLEWEDRRFFLLLVARAVRRGEFEVLAFVLMTNHFHLVVRSRGALSEAMRRIENEYARYFNKRYGLEGALFRGRFRSVRVEDLNHLRNAIRYCDDNPMLVRPRPADRPEDYEWCSAHRFARPCRTPWLSSRGIDAVGISYCESTSAPCSFDERMARRWFIHARLRCGDKGDESLGVVLSGDPARILAWLRRQAPASSPRRTHLPVAGRKMVRFELGKLGAADAQHVVSLEGARRYHASDLLLAGLLRRLSALNYAEIAVIAGCSDTTAKRRCALHARALQEDPAYADLACRLVAACVAPLRM